MKDLLLTLEKNLNCHFENEIQRFERRKDEDYDEVLILLTDINSLSGPININSLCY